jgi:hypothetical protein
MHPDLVLAHFGVAVLGFVVGIFFLPIYEAVYWRVARYARGDLSTDNRSQAITMLATILACTFSGAVLLGALYVFGLFPLGNKAPIFFWFWLFGAALFRAFGWYRERQSRMAREKNLDESIRLEIQERQYEQQSTRNGNA